VSLQDQKRVLEALYALTEDDVQAGASYAELAAQLGLTEDDFRLTDSLHRLWEVDYVELGESAARITAKGVWSLGKGERPPEQFLGGG
jgi:hypothetical protein